MPPYVVRDGPPGVTRLFTELAAAIDLPLILQNAPPPLGSAYGPDAIKDLVAKVPQIRYVKEETSPGGQRITRLLDDPPAALAGVFGGAGGRFIMDELNRGAIGAMPASEITEVHVRIFELYRQGDVADARALYNRSLPLLTERAMAYEFKVWGFGEDICLRALLEFSRHTGDVRAAEIVVGLVRPWCVARLGTKTHFPYADHVAPGVVILDLHETTGDEVYLACLLYTSPSPRDGLLSRMPSSA